MGVGHESVQCYTRGGVSVLGVVLRTKHYNQTYLAKNPKTRILHIVELAHNYGGGGYPYLLTIRAGICDPHGSTWFKTPKNSAKNIAEILHLYFNKWRIGT